jgi:hypothetical protein
VKILDYDHTRFIRYEAEISDGLTHSGVTTPAGEIIEHLIRVDTLAEAHGVWTPCPLCCRVGHPHGVLSFFPNAPLHPDTDLGKNKAGQDVRWTPTGTSLADLTLSPSIQIQGGCNWHGWIQNGETVDA